MRGRSVRMARSLTALLLATFASQLADAQEPTTALVLFDMHKEVALATRANLEPNLPLAPLEQTRALFESVNVGRLSSPEIEQFRVRGGLGRLILVDTVGPPKDGQAVYRIRVFSGDEPQLRFQATAGDDQRSAGVIAASVLELVRDPLRGRAAAH